MTWYHGTTEAARTQILASRFQPQGGIWGTGCYFTSSIEGAAIFGSALLCADIPDEAIAHVDYIQWLEQHPNEELWPAAVQLIGRAVAIHYEGGEVELFVADPTLMSMATINSLTIN